MNSSTFWSCLSIPNFGILASYTLKFSLFFLYFFFDILKRIINYKLHMLLELGGNHEGVAAVFTLQCNALEHRPHLMNSFSLAFVSLLSRSCLAFDLLLTRFWLAFVSLLSRFCLALGLLYFRLCLAFVSFFTRFCLPFISLTGCLAKVPIPLCNLVHLLYFLDLLMSFALRNCRFGWLY